jgi:uncharacterized protein
MTNHMSRVGALLLVTLMAVSCSSSDQREPVVDINGAQVPARMKIYYPVGNAIANVLTKNLPGVLVTAETSSGSSQNIRMLDANQIHFGMSNASITYPAINGSGEFEKPFPVKAVISLHASINLFIALKSANIATIADFRGKRIGLGPAGGGWDYYTKPILAAHGLTFDDITPVYETQANATDLLADGAVDAIMVGGSVPHATVMAATASHDIVFIPFDEAAIDKVFSGYPFIKKFKIPARAYKGLDSDFWAADVGTAQLLTRADADPNVIYLITKTIYENRAAVAEMHRAGAEITPERAGMDIGIPYHEGALRYFQEIGIWNPRPTPGS